jgi:hypothetical protein
MYTSALINHSGGTGNYSVTSLCWYRNWPESSFILSSSVNTIAILQDINHLPVQTCSKTFMYEYVCYGGLSEDLNGFVADVNRRINITSLAKIKFSVTFALLSNSESLPHFSDFKSGVVKVFKMQTQFHSTRPDINSF